MADETPENPVEQPDKLEEARQLVARQEKANAETRALLERQEKLRAEQIIMGRADAGSAPQKPKELTPKEYAQAVLKGDFNKPKSS